MHVVHFVPVCEMPDFGVVGTRIASFFLHELFGIRQGDPPPYPIAPTGPMPNRLCKNRAI